MTMPRQFSLAYLTIPGIDPVRQIEIAKQAGYDYVSLRTIPMGQQGEPQVHLETDPELARAVEKALKDHDMKLFDIELLRIREDLPTDYRAAFEKGAQLGATQILTSVWTKDYSLAVDRYGAFCEQAAEFGMTALKARKLLITAGVYSTALSRQVTELHDGGVEISRIMKITGLSRASIHSYLPYTV